MRNITIPIKYPKFPSLTLTTNPVCLYRYTKASVLAPRTRTTISSASLNCLASLLHLVVSLSWSYLANGILWTCLPRTRRLGQESPTASLLLTARVISLKRLIARRLLYKCKIDGSFLKIYVILTFFSWRWGCSFSYHRKNGLESYTYTAFVNSLTKKPADKFDAADKSRLETAVNETIKWFAT